jgi:hypothetical protein
MNLVSQRVERPLLRHPIAQNPDGGDDVTSDDATRRAGL